MLIDESKAKPDIQNTPGKMNDINSYDVQIDKYDLFLDIDHTKSNFNGRSTLVFKTPLAGSNEILNLYIDDLIIIEYTINGEHTYNDSEFHKDTHTTSLKLHGHDSISEISIVYIGKISQISTFKDKTYGIFKTNIMNESGNSNNIVISTHCQPNFASKIFPCLLNSKSKFNLTIKTDSRFKVISNTGVSSSSFEDGANVTATGSSPNKRIVTFKETPYMQHAVFSFTIGDLESIQTTIETPQNSNFPITIYSATSIQDCSFALDIITKYFKKLNNEIFHKNPYHLDKLDFVALPFLSDYAMENHGMVSIQMNHIMLSKLVKSSSQYKQMEQLLVHELVHLWMGNYISFNWENLWFNESFATYLANEVIENGFTNEEYLSNYYQPLLENVQSSTIKEGLPSTLSFENTTDQLFNPQSYMKGIPIIRSLVEMVGLNKFVESLDSFFTNYEKIIDPCEIFESLNVEDSYNWYISEFKQAPTIKITNTKVDGLKDTDTFPVYLDNGLVVKANEFLKWDIEEINKHYLFNSKAIGLYHVKYENDKVIEKLLQEMSEDKNINEFDFYSILQDLQKNIQTGENLTKYDISLPISLLTEMVSKMDVFVQLKSNNHVYNRAISMILEILEKLQLSIVKYGSGEENESILNVDVYSKLLKPLFFKFKDTLCDTDVSGLNVTKFHLEDVSELEWSVLSRLIFLLKRDSDIWLFSTQVIKTILSGRPIKSKIPAEIIGSCMASYASRVDNVKDWKKIFNMVKNCEPYMNHVDYNTDDYQSVKEASYYIQNSITQNIGFVLSPSIVAKVLNFVYTNIESTSIELLLFGIIFNYKREFNDSEINNNTVKESNMKDLVWNWYESNFDHIAQRSLREGSESAAALLKTWQNISILVFSMFLIEDSSKIDQFILLKHSKFNKNLQLDKVWELVKEREMHYIMLYQLLLQLKYDL